MLYMIEKENERTGKVAITQFNLSPVTITVYTFRQNGLKKSNFYLKYFHKIFELRKCILTKKCFLTKAFLILVSITKILFATYS